MTKINLERQSNEILPGKQDTLISGTNIKTINGNSLLGSGDITISGGSGTPGGSDTQLQYNNAGAFGGIDTVTWDNTNKKLIANITSDKPVLEVKTNGNIVDVGALKLWDNTADGFDKLISIGNGTTFTPHIELYASGYIDVVRDSGTAYDTHVMGKDTIAFNAGRMATGAGASSSLTGLFTASSAENDSNLYGFFANMGSTNVGGMLLKGTGSTSSTANSNHLIIWGNTANNTNKGLSIGNGTTFQQNFFIQNDGTVNLTSSTASRILATDASKNITALDTTTYPSLTELSYVKGVTSSIQTQLNAKQASDTQLTSLAGLSYTGNALKVIRVNAGETDFELATVSAGPSFGTDNQIPYVNAGGTDFDYSANLTFNGTALALAGNQTISQGTITTDLKALDVSATWNAAGVNFTGIRGVFTNTASGATSKMISLSQGSTAEFSVNKNGQTEIFSNSALGYGAYGLKLRDYSSGVVAVIQPYSGGGIYITDGSGTAAPLLLGTRTNPGDGSTFIAGFGRWIINTGAFVVNRSTWAGTAQTEFVSTALPQIGAFYDNSNYMTATVASNGSTTFDLTGTSPEFTFSQNVTLPTLTTTGNIELGHASDTTLSRSSAGVLAVEGVVIPSISSTNTLTNKRITKRTGTTTSSATPTINTDNVDFYSLTAQAVDITSFTTNLSGTPTEGQTLWIAITGTAARAITWGSSFEASTVALPTTTVTTNRLDVGFVWNTVTSKWRCVASA